MLDGECLKVRITSCLDCEEELRLDVQSSAAGYYLGFFCNTCGPQSRESGYYETYELAALQLSKPMEVWERCNELER